MLHTLVAACSTARNSFAALSWADMSDEEDKVGFPVIMMSVHFYVVIGLVVHTGGCRCNPLRPRRARRATFTLSSDGLDWPAQEASARSAAS